MAISCWSKDAIRVKHIPSGYDIVVQAYRGQHRNRSVGIKTIKAKLYANKIGLERPTIDEDVSDTVCPICEKGVLEQAHEYLHYEYKNGSFYENPLSNEYEVLSLYLVCKGGEDACKSEQLDGYCLKYNKETMELLYEMLDRRYNNKT